MLSVLVVEQSDYEFAVGGSRYGFVGCWLCQVGVGFVPCMVCWFDRLIEMVVGQELTLMMPGQVWIGVYGDGAIIVSGQIAIGDEFDAGVDAIGV